MRLLFSSRPPCGIFSFSRVKTPLPSFLSKALSPVVGWTHQTSWVQFVPLNGLFLRNGIPPPAAHSFPAFLGPAFPPQFPRPLNLSRCSFVEGFQSAHIFFFRLCWRGSAFSRQGWFLFYTLFHRWEVVYFGDSVFSIFHTLGCSSPSRALGPSVFPFLGFDTSPWSPPTRYDPLFTWIS